MPPKYLLVIKEQFWRVPDNGGCAIKLLRGTVLQNNVFVTSFSVTFSVNFLFVLKH